MADECKADFYPVNLLFYWKNFIYQDIYCYRAHMLVIQF